MNNTINIIQSHRSIRRFSEKQIEQDLLDNILLAGQSAATSSFIQATTVIRITDEEKRAELVELTGGQKYVASAAEFFVLCADLYRNSQRSKSEGVDADFGWTEQFIAATVDVGLFAQNMVVAAQSADLGCCYIGGIRNNPERVSEMLGLPELVYPVFGLCMGYPEQNPGKKPRLPLSVAVHQNHYQTDEQMSADIAEYDKTVQAYYVERTRGKLDFSWSQQMAKQAQSQTRPFMQAFLQSKGFLKK